MSGDINMKTSSTFTPNESVNEINSVNGKKSIIEQAQNSVNENIPFLSDLSTSVNEIAKSVNVNETRRAKKPLKTSTAILNTQMLVDEFDTEDRLDKKFITKQLQHIPYSVRIVAKNTYNRFFKLDSNGKFQANSYLRTLAEFTKNLAIDVTWSESQIELIAKSRADMCHSYAANLAHQGEMDDEVLSALESVLLQNNISPRKGKYVLGDISRYCSDKWWHKKLTRLQNIELETLSQYVRIVSKQSQIYLSDANFQRGREKKRRNKIFLDSLEAVNEKGESVDLKVLADSNTSNPVNRRNELMTRLHGCEVYGDKHHYVADFLTVTCPSRMHSVHNNGKPNDKYDETTPKQANQYLGGQWAKTRAHLARLNVDYFGFRVAEPHHDGTPHWHILVFVKPKDRHVLRETMSHYALEVDGDEKGASKYRFKIDPINKAKGSAVGYIAKYISKNIDGFGLEKDEYGKASNESALRVCEWSSLWGIRQFQQFGGPPVTLWREARRLALTEEVNITPVWVAADKGDWCEFIEALGGVNVARKDLPVSLVKEFIETEGEYWEPIGYVVVGLSCGGEIYSSREHTWTKRRKENVSSLGLGENEV